MNVPFTYRPFLVILMVFSSTMVLAQGTIIKGQVRDSLTGEPLELANIRLLETSRGAATDEHGYFFIVDIPPGSYTIMAERIGYAEQYIRVTLREGESLSLGFALVQTQYSLEEVAVSASRTKARTQIKVSEIEVLPSDIARMPTVGSMPDIAQHLQTLPGVVSSGDAGGRIYVRGGSPVQNRVFLDGAVIYSPFHTSGLHSVFDLDAVRKTEVYTGGFGAEYGSSLSSIIDVTTRYGNINAYSGSADISTIGSKLLLEGPVFRPKPDGKSNASFLAYYKTSYFDRAAQTYYSYVDRDLPFSFQDLYGKFSLFSGEVFKANLYGFSFHDHSGGGEALFDYRWKNQGFGSNFFISPPQSSLLMQLFFAVSSFRMELEETNYVPRESGVNSVNLGLRISKYLGNHYFKYGLELLTLSTDYFYYSTDYNRTEQENNTSEVAGYFTFFGNFNRLLFRPGLRSTLYSALNKLTLEPRLSMKYLVSERFRLKMAGGYYTQNLISAISDRDIVNYFHGYLSAPVNVVTTSRYTSPYILQQALHLVLGAEVEAGERVFINVEGYLKDYPTIINYNRDKLLNEYDHPDKPQIITRDFILESGTAWGMEATLDYRAERLSLALVYSFAKTERTYEAASGEKVTYPPHFDRRHNINILGSFLFGREQSWEVGARWNLGSGFPFTPSKGYFESNTIDDLQIGNLMEQNGTLDIFYGTYNAGRLPAYHRLDLSLKKRFMTTGRVGIEAELNVVNVYNRENIYYIDRATNETVYQLPVLPGLRLGITF